MGGSSSVRGDQTIYHTDNLCFDGTDRGSPMAADGQLWIGATASDRPDNGGHVKLGTLTAGTGVTITNGPGTISIASNGMLSIQGDSGAPVSGPNISLFGHSGSATAGSTVSFVSASATEMDLRVTDSNLNTLIGQFAGNNSIVTVGANTSLGYTTLFSLTTGTSNTAIGYGSETTLTSGEFNTALGNGSLSALITGNRNISIGYSSGSGYVGSESDNIVIGNIGTIGESNKIRIGTQGTGQFQQDQCYLAGVLNTVSGRVVKVTSPGAYPYTTLITDYVILVDSSSARTIVPLASPVTGTTYRIKDNVGSAATNTITITPSGKNIDGAASTTITTNYGSIDICYNGTQWIIL